MLQGWYGESLATLGRYREASIAHARARDSASVVGPATRTLLITMEASGPLQRDDIEAFAEHSDHYLAEARRYDLGYSIMLGELTVASSHLILSPDPSQLPVLDDIQTRMAGNGRILAVPIFAWLVAQARRSCGALEAADETAALAQAVVDLTDQRWLDGHLCAFRLQLADELGRLPDDWFEASQPVFDLVRARSLRTGALYLASQRRLLAADGPHAETAHQQLRSAYDAMPEPSDSPLFRRAEHLLGDEIRP